MVGVFATSVLHNAEGLLFHPAKLDDYRNNIVALHPPLLFRHLYRVRTTVLNCPPGYFFLTVDRNLSQKSANRLK
jgi:hypothetical protein